MPDVPSWWEATLLTLAAWRIWRLLAKDTVLDRPRRAVLRLGDWEEDSGRDPPADYRYSWGDFLTCPWCLGFYIALGWWTAWMLWPHAATVIAVPLAISTAVGLLAKLDDD